LLTLVGVGHLVIVLRCIAPHATSHARGRGSSRNM